MPDLAAIAQLLIQFSPDAMIVVNRKGIIRYANQTCLTLFGYAPGSLIGQPLERLIPERFTLRHGAHVTQFLRAPSNREMGARLTDLFARRADGSEFPAAIRLATMHLGDEPMISAAIRDVSERREITEALVQAREEADRANRAKSRFLATASHDLRQPLQTVRMLNASLLRLTAGTDPRRELLERQEAAIDGASRLLNALLDISRLESGAIEAQLAPVSLGSVYAELEREFEGACAEKGLNLSLPSSRSVISTDKVLLTQLCQNLLGNAVKYTDKGFVRLTETVTPEDLTLTVEDSGVGIPAEKLDRIFDEYYQVSPEGTQRLGVGLGLAIVREVARLLGYSVSVLSSVGKGTEVSVRIPRHLLLCSTTSTPALERPLEVGVGEASHGGILLLEDNDSVRLATELFLTLEGYRVRSAATLADAEEVLKGLDPKDILVLDYHLEADLTGLDILKQVRVREGRDVPAVLLSGDLQAMMRNVRTPLPRTRFLSKPVDTKALLNALSELAAEE